MFKPRTQSDINNRFLMNPNSGLQFGSNYQTYSGGVTGKAGQTFANPQDESSYWDNDPTYRQMISKMQSMPVGTDRDALRQQIEDYRSNKFNVQALPSTTTAPTVANPLAPVTSTATKTATPATPALAPPAPAPAVPTATPTATPTPTPATTPTPAPTTATAPTASSSPCDGLMEDIDKANKMRKELEAEMGPSHVNGQFKPPSDQHHSMMGFVNQMLINAHKRMTECIAMHEKERAAPIEKARKEKMAAAIKSNNDAKAFHANAQAYGQNQSNDAVQKAGALLSMGKISPEQYQTMTADPSTYADTITRMHSQNFNMDTNSPNEGGNETVGYQPHQTPVEPPPAAYGTQNSGRYDRYKQEKPFDPSTIPYYLNNTPGAHPNYSAYG